MNKKSISFQSHNQILVGTLFFPEQISKKLPAVVFYHGRGSRQERYFRRAEELCSEGFIVMTFSFRGCGESEGEFDKLTTADGIDDALAAFDFLFTQDHVDKDRMGIAGGSYGGYLAAIVSTKRNVKSLVLTAPATYRDEWMNLPYASIPIDEVKRFEIGIDFQNIAYKAIEEYRGNLLVIRHEKDEVVPKEVVNAYYEKAGTENKQMIVIKNAPHKLEGNFHDQVMRKTAEWFTQNL